MGRRFSASFSSERCVRNSVVVDNEPFDSPSQVLLSQNDRMIQALASDRSNHTLSVCVLPWRGRRRQYFAQSNRFDVPAEKRAEFSVSIANNVFGRFLQASCLDDLPRRPRRRR